MDATRGDAIDEDVLKTVKGTDFDLGSNLDALAKLPVEQQQAVAAHVRNGDLVSAKAAISPPKVGPSADQTGNGTPANDARSIDKQIAALTAVWNKACPEARDRFLKQIDRLQFDDTHTGNHDWQNDDDTTHHLSFAEARDCGQGDQDRVEPQQSQQTQWQPHAQGAPTDDDHDDAALTMVRHCGTIDHDSSHESRGGRIGQACAPDRQHGVDQDGLGAVAH